MLFRSAYLDDIIIYSQTEEDHWEHIRIVFDAFLQAGLKIRASKAAFFRHEIELLGRIIDKNGVRLTPRQERVMANYPRPHNVISLQRFLGFGNYVANMVRDFHRMAHPLYQLLKKGITFEWTPECEDAFLTIKQRVNTSIMLSFLPPNHDLYLAADASQRGLGVIAYYIKSFTREQILNDPPDHIYATQFTRDDYLRDTRAKIGRAHV